MKKLLTTLCFAVLCISTAFAQGVTTSSMKGKVTDSNGEALIGATVMAVHQPSGTVYGTITDENGNYRFANMRVGGPYKVTFSYTGFQENTSDGIYLRLGETYPKSVSISESTQILDVVTIIGRAGASGQDAGASTQISEEAIELMPTLNRDLNDYTRLTPQARQTFDGGITIAGINNRYNAIYIDGAVNNDVFGIAANGTNGGQTGISPISADVLDQIQVVVSPYDVTYGGFAGGGINAVTKSGTNTFEGTVYYFQQNERLAGKTNQTIIDQLDDGTERTELAPFRKELYGVSLGGPIVKDKVHFFVNAEIQDDQTPEPFNFGTYDGDASEDDINEVSTFMQRNYGYDPGTFGSKTETLEGLKLFGKVDIAIGEDHNLSLRHQYTEAEQIRVNGSTNRSLEFANNGVFFPSKTNSTALELNSRFGTKFSNNLILGFTTVRDDRDPIGGDFPYLEIGDGGGTLFMGSEEFSTANQLDQDIFTITDNFKMYKGDHTITIGTHNEFSSFYNLFMRQNYGVYEYDSISQFLNGLPASHYDRSYSLVDNVTGDGSAAAAEFNAIQLGFYVQDEWTVNNKLSVTGGVRVDIPILTTDPTVFEDFNTTTLPAIQARYEEAAGAEGGVAPDGQIMFSPRLGFSYDVAGDRKTIIRGGLGLFTSRIPFVWPAGMYTNNGITIGGVDEGDINGDVNFISDINNQYTNADFSIPSGQVDLYAKDFKYPQMFRASLGIDREIFGGVEATLEGIYTKTVNNIVYKNINSAPDVDFNWTNGGDDRPIYTREDIDERYSAVYLGTNTSEGNSYTATLSLARNFDLKSGGLNAFLAFSYGDANSLIEGTSSQNSSQWRGGFHVDGRNDPAYGRSDFALGGRIVGALGYKHHWGKDRKTSTTISIFYNGEDGAPYSYVYGGSAARNINNETGSTSRNRSLVYIPTDQNDISLVEYTSGGETVTVADQWNRLNTFIEQDDYLSENRGQYAEKNSNRTPFTSQFDVKLMQDFVLSDAKDAHRLQLSLDIFNFANFLDKKAGVVYSNPFDFWLLQYEGLDTDGTTPQFSFRETDLGDDIYQINDFLSRYRMRVGIRYIFN